MLIKGFLVGALCVIGCLMLYAGAGGTIPYLKYDALEAYELPVGIAALLAAIALAKWWRVETTTIWRTTEITGDGPGQKSVVTEIEKRSGFGTHGNLPDGDKKL